MVNLDSWAAVVLVLFVLVAGFAFLTNRRDTRIAAFVLAIIYAVLELIILISNGQGV